MSKLKALSIRQPFAEEILTGEKVIEYRSWSVGYRGPLLIHAGLSKAEEGHEGLPRGCLVGVVQLVDITHAGDRDYHWHLSNPARFVSPIPFKGAVGILPVPLELVQDVELILPDGTSAGETLAAYLASTGEAVP